MCDRCLAGAGRDCPPRMDYRNFGPTRAWPLTELGHEQYVLRDRAALSPWLKMPGFRLETMAWDWMHNVYLGTGRDLLGSGIRLLVLSGVYSSTGLVEMDDILSHVQQRIRSKCSKHRFLSCLWRKRIAMRMIVGSRNPSELVLVTKVYLSFKGWVQPRLSIPSKPHLNLQALGGDDDYAELSSRFKASHVKLLLWWISFEATHWADRRQDDSLNYYSMLLIYYHYEYWKLSIYLGCFLCWLILVDSWLVDMAGW